MNFQNNLIKFERTIDQQTLPRKVFFSIFIAYGDLSSCHSSILLTPQIQIFRCSMFFPFSNHHYLFIGIFLWPRKSLVRIGSCCSIVDPPFLHPESAGVQGCCEKPQPQITGVQIKLIINVDVLFSVRRWHDPTSKFQWINYILMLSDGTVHVCCVHWNFCLQNWKK